MTIRCLSSARPRLLALRLTLDPGSADPDAPASWAGEEINRLHPKALGEPNEPVNGEVLQPTLEPGQVAHADPEAGGVPLLRPALSVSQLCDSASDVLNQSRRIFLRHHQRKAGK